MPPLWFENIFDVPFIDKNYPESLRLRPSVRWRFQNQVRYWFPEDTELLFTNKSCNSLIIFQFSNWNVKRSWCFSGLMAKGRYNHYLSSIGRKIIIMIIIAGWHEALSITKYSLLTPFCQILCHSSRFTTVSEVGLCVDCNDKWIRIIALCPQNNIAWRRRGVGAAPKWCPHWNIAQLHYTRRGGSLLLWWNTWGRNQNSTSKFTE